MLNNKISLTLLFIFILNLTGCKKDDTGTNIQPVKDPRTYTWTADTLAYPGSFQTLMTDIWGSSPNDVYVVGHNDQNRGLMWHFDGNKWTDVHLIVSQGGKIEGAIDLASIHGFSSTDIYAVGDRIFGYNPNPPPNFIDSSLVIHYDGSQWTESVMSPRGRRLLNVYGKTSNDLWAVGLDKTVLHYDGIKWIKDTLPFYKPEPYMFVESVAVNSIGVYADAQWIDNTGSLTYYLFKKTNDTWNLIDSCDGNNPKFNVRMWTSPEGTIYSVGDGIFKYDGNSWTKIFSQGIIADMNGTSDDNIIAVGAQGNAYHYNGTDWKVLEPMKNYNINYGGVWTDGKEAFIIGFLFESGSQKTIVWHGK